MFRPVVGLSIVAVLFAQKPADVLAGEMAKRLSDEMQVKTVVGKALTVGSVTLIPILNVEVTFGGAGLLPPPSPPSPTSPQPAPAARPAAAAASKAAQSPPLSGDLFLMNGEARPLGFIVVSKQGTRFISLREAVNK